MAAMLESEKWKSNGGPIPRLDPQIRILGASTVIDCDVWAGRSFVVVDSIVAFRAVDGHRSMA